MDENPQENPEHITEDQARALLKKYASDDRTYKMVLDHTSTVKDIALRTAAHIHDVDSQFIATAALLHDIGRFTYPPGTSDSIKHGIAGAAILRKEGLPKHARVAECHIGIGITRSDIISQGLDLPQKNYVPVSREEMIITYADNLDYRGEKDESFVEERFAREISEAYRKRVQAFHKKIHDMIEEKK